MNSIAYVLDDGEVEDAVMATLKKWVGTELSDIELSRGLASGHYARPRSWEFRTDFDSFSEDQTPRVIVVSLGFADEPAMRGNKQYTHFYLVGIATIASSTDQMKSRRYAYRLSSAVAASLINHQSLDQGIDGRVQGIDLLERKNGEIPPDAERTIWMVRQTFRVEVKDAITKNGGRITPNEPTNPGTGATAPDWPTVTPPAPDGSGVTIDYEGN